MTAGIDFGLVVAAQLCGEETAKLIQLLLEYNPALPFNAGSPENAGEAVVKQVRRFGGELIKASLIQTQETAKLLGTIQ